MQRLISQGRMQGTEHSSWADTGMRGSFCSFLEPGQFVVHPVHPEWGTGQVQSAIGVRVTVNFEHQGKVLIDASRAELQIFSG